MWSDSGVDDDGNDDDANDDDNDDDDISWLPLHPWAWPSYFISLFHGFFLRSPATITI